MGVAELAEQAGRDPSTVSHQLAKLEQLGLVIRSGQDDRRVRAASIMPAGARALAAITSARRQLLGELVKGWSAEEREIFPVLVQRLADAMKTAVAEPGAGRFAVKDD